MENSKVIEKKENILGWEKIGKLIAKFSIPGIIAMVVNSLYNMVDQIFIGQGVGYLGNGATNVIFPLTTFALAVFLLISDGTASYMSLMLGRKRDEDAARGVSAGILSAISSGIILCIIFIAFLKPLCKLFGATDLIMPYAMDYGFIIALGMPFFSVAVGFAGPIRADGSPAYNMIGLVAGCVTNIILDPIFIILFNWGVKGAALATIIGQFVNAVIYFIYAFKFKSVKIKREPVKSCLKAIPEIAKLGVSSFMNQAVLVVLVGVQNNMLKTYGGMSDYGEEIPMTALGVTMKLFNIIIAIIIGLSAGAQPIVGYNYGSGDMKRVKKTFLYTNIIAFLTMTIAFILFQTVPRPILSIFGHEDELYMEFSVKCLRIYLLALPLMAIKFVTTSYLQAIGYPFWSAILSLSKQIILQLPFLLILPIYIGIDGVLWAGPVSDVLAFILTLSILFFGRKKFFNAAVHDDKEDELIERESELTSLNNASNIDELIRTEFLESDENQQVKIFKKLVGNENFVITIGRTYGAGGRSVGKALAQKLGIKYYDKSILKRASMQSGLSEEFLLSGDEKAKNEQFTANVDLAKWQNTETSEYYKQAELAKLNTILKCAEDGPCVIVGRRSDKILMGKVVLYRVFISSSMEKRVERVMLRENLSEEDARQKIVNIDKERALYYSNGEKSDWGKVENYDLVLDCTSLTADLASDIIIKGFSAKLQN